MAVLATLGEIEFEPLSSGMTGISSKREWNFVQHEVLNGKPTTQAVGGKLDSLDLSLQFHVGWCDPEANLNALVAAARSQEALPLTLGGVYSGKWIVESISEDYRQLAPGSDETQTRVVLMNVRVSLTEWVGQSKTQVSKIKAFAGVFRNQLGG